jgi:hypothetical protein
LALKNFDTKNGVRKNVDEIDSKVSFFCAAITQYSENFVKISEEAKSKVVPTKLCISVS